MANLFELNSLRAKITSVYLALAVSTVILGIVAISDLLFLTQQVTEGEVVSDLKNAVSEMRREEKNLFLYDDRDALANTEQHAIHSIQIISDNQTLFNSMLAPDTSLNLLDDINQYRNHLQQWQGTAIKMREALQEQMRTLGHTIYTRAATLAKLERHLLQSAIRKSQWFFMFCVLLIGISIYVVGYKLKQLVVNPLKQLESQLKQIAKGDFNQLEPPSNDREFITFTLGFNRMLKELEIRQKRMLQSEKLASLGILASGVAHELNNPLSNISSSCQLLIEELQEADPEQLHRWLQQIDSETERGRKIVRTLLDFGSQHSFEKQRIKLLSLIKETQMIIGKSLGHSASRLTINIPQDLQLEVDKQRIQQLLINLIQNALHAGGEEVHIKISAVVIEQISPSITASAVVAGDIAFLNDYAGTIVEILVIDDGPGIPQKHLKQVFDPFFTTSEPGKGVGLGLYISQEIIREHHGCLALSTQADKGTCITILLPGLEHVNDE